MGECWLWAGMVSSQKPNSDYGQVYYEGKTYRAHRFVYEALVGDIPEGLVLDHLCRTPRCVNPEHLEPVTNKENILRGTCPMAINARKTHCKRGHEFTPENTMIKKRYNYRICRICHNNQVRESIHRLYYPGKYIGKRQKQLERKKNPYT